MANAFVIEHRHVTAGIAVRERGGFRFYASHALFFSIEARKFRRLRELHAAIARLADSARFSVAAFHPAVEALQLS
ncbi:MAG TPA: hypothetical protein VEI03_16335 [Stellaceae bacterium]|nr:hypothetical protein [Stellaceae bacterium]